MIAPVGQACWHGASSQCLQTSLIISQRLLVVADLLLERDVPPGRRREVAGVVVAVAGEVEAVGGELVPLLAGHLARLAADAERGVGEEARRPARGSGGVPRRNGSMRRSTAAPAARRGGSAACGSRDSSSSLLSCVNCPSGWADAGVSGIGSRVGQGAGRHRRRRAAAVEPAGLDLAGEHLALVHADVRVGHQRGQVVGDAADRLAGEAPVERQADLVDDPARRRCSGLSRRVTIARASIAPRGERTVSQPPCSMPRSAASSGLSSTNISGCSSLSQLVEPAHRPAQVVLGQAERAGDDGILRRRRVGDRVERPLEVARRRAVVLLRDRAGCRPATRPARSASATGRPWSPPGANSQPRPSGFMMNGCVAGDGVHALRVRRRAGSRAACPARSPARRRRPTSSAPRPTRCSFLRSDQGRPSGSAEARLYMIRRLCGQAKPQSGCTGLSVELAVAGAVAARARGRRRCRSSSRRRSMPSSFSRRSRSAASACRSSGRSRRGCSR